MGQLHLLPGIVFSILLISKPPATRGRECYIFMASYACGDVRFNKGIAFLQKGFPGTTTAGFSPFIYLTAVLLTAPEI